jgi:O-antigen ligase
MRLRGIEPRRTAAPPVPGWCLGAAAGLGLLVLLVVQLEAKWFLFLFFFGLLALVSLGVPNRQNFFLVLLTFSLSVWVGMHLDFTRSVFGRSTFGFPIHFSLLPLAALYAIWVGQRATLKEPAPVSTRGLVPLAGLLAVAALSLLAAPDKKFALFDLFALLTSILIFVYVSSEIRTLKELRLLVAVLVASAVLQASVALLQWLTGSSLGADFFGTTTSLYGYVGLETLSRVSGLMGHPNNLAMFFDLMLPLTFSLLFCPLGGWPRCCLALAVFLEVLALGVTYSRGGLGASILALWGLLVFHLSRSLGLMRAFFSGLLAAVLFLALILAVPNPIQKGLFRTEFATAYGRVPLMEVAFNLIRHRPLLGSGLNNYVQVAREYDYTPGQLTMAWNTPVHNLFLFIAGELGLPGLICFLAFLLSVLMALYPVLRAPDPFLLCTGAGIFFGLLAFCLHAQVDYGVWTQNRLLWFLLGLAVAVGRLHRNAAPGPPVSETWG